MFTDSSPIDTNTDRDTHETEFGYLQEEHRLAAVVDRTRRWSGAKREIYSH